MEIAEYHKYHGIEADEDGWYWQPKIKGGLPVGGQEYLDNIKVNVARKHPSLKKSIYDRRPFVYVGGGPTMKDYLDTIRDMASRPDEYIVTCTNNTGKFLIENWIIPHVHWIIDPKQSKAKDFDVTHEDTEYWLNVGCHPDVFDNVESQGRKIKTFLAVSNIGDQSFDVTECHEGMKANGIDDMVLVAGGMTAGLRAMTLAEALGCRKVEYFGFDGCMVGGEVYSYDKKRTEPIIEVEAEDGRIFESTPFLSAQATQFLVWQEMLPWINVKIHGDGFIRHMVELQKTREIYSRYRFSLDYKQLQQQFHEECATYGTSGTAARIVKSLSEQIGGTVLDYGCGKQALKKALPDVEIVGYDPFIPGLDKEPEAADIVVCADVMEHVEVEYVRGVLDHIQSLTKKVAVFIIQCAPAQKTLPDGRNAHITLMPHDWWFKRVKERFLPSEVSESETSLIIVAQSIPAVEEKLYAHR